MKRLYLSLLLTCITALGFSQQSSEHGWYLPVNDTLRILVVFIEIDYDVDPELDGPPNGRTTWPAGELPTYADLIFDHTYHENPEGTMTQYYHQMSLGNFWVFGDYIPEVFTIPYSSIKRTQTSRLFSYVSDKIEEKGEVVTAHGLKLKDFDLWLDSKGSGREKEHNTSGEFEGVDHIMAFIRNYHTIPKSTGRASGSSFGIIGGKRTDTHSMFNGGHDFPFSILKHELNHLFIGGNNFHCGGGNSSGFTSYFPSVQGGWCMMGAANSSLLTCAGWDRYWLGWKHPENEFLISARDENRKEVNGDINAENGDGIFILRDFVTTGDALRIKLPFIPEHQYQQWIWIENHTTEGQNGSQFDVFQFEENECIADATPGVFMALQIDANTKEGKAVYGKLDADYLRPIPADGNYDYRWLENAPDLPICISPNNFSTYMFWDKYENPLTGNHGEEFPFKYSDERKITTELGQVPANKFVDGEYQRMVLNGHPSHGFREGGNSVLGIGTNPSSASMLSLLNKRRQPSKNEKNNREIYLSGLKVEILQTLSDGSVKLKLRFDDHEINENRRWCAPTILLNDHRKEGTDLTINANLVLDWGKTMTRFDNPDSLRGEKYFTDPTTLEVLKDAEIQVNKKLILKKESALIVHTGSKLNTRKKSKVIIHRGTMHIEKGAEIEIEGRIRIKKNGKIFCREEENYRKIKKKTWNDRRVILLD